MIFTMKPAPIQQNPHATPEFKDIQGLTFYKHFTPNGVVCGVPLISTEWATSAQNSGTTFPHHKHIPPDIKHHRILASNMSFTQANLPALIQEVEELIKQENATDAPG